MGAVLSLTHPVRPQQHFPSCTLLHRVEPPWAVGDLSLGADVTSLTALSLQL